jgi:Protein of unknown function (DUF664)
VTAGMLVGERWLAWCIVIGEDASTHWADDLRHRVDELIDEFRASLHDCLEGLSEEEARMSLVPSKTTLLGLVKHVTFVEGVWFDQAVTGRTYEAIGIATTPERSFTLQKSDTIASVQAEYRRRCERSRRTMAALAPDDVVEGRGARSVWALHLQVLRELAQHAGHADILREQILARRAF